MEEKNNEEKKSDFKAVKNTNNIKTAKIKKEKTNLGFVKGFLVPFISGVLEFHLLENIFLETTLAIFQIHQKI